MTHKLPLDDLLHTEPTAISTTKDSSTTENKPANDTKLTEEENLTTPEYKIIKQKKLPQDIGKLSEAFLSDFLSAQELESKTEDNFDDLPSDEEMQRQAGHYLMEIMLESSNQQLNEIANYLQTNKIQTIPVTEFTQKNHFTFNGTRYLLESEDLLQQIYNLILNFKSKTTQRTLLKKQRSLSGILEEFPETKPAFKHEVLLKLDYDNIKTLLKRAF